MKNKQRIKTMMSAALALAMVSGSIPVPSQTVTAYAEEEPQEQKNLPTASLANNSFDYTGEVVAPEINFAGEGEIPVEDRDYTVSYKKEGEGDSLDGAPTNAGSYVLVITPTGDTYKGESQELSFIITKVVAKYETPTAKENLEYTGAAQDLVEGGSTQDGTMEYRLNGQDWSENIPTATAAGDYTVYYKVRGDANHEDVVPEEPINVSIVKAKPSTSEPKAIDKLVYNGEAQPLVEEGSTEDGTFRYRLEGDTEWSTEVPTGTDAGDYTVYYKVEGDENHESISESSTTVTIAPADREVTAPKAVELTYNGSGQALVMAGSVEDGTMEYSLNGVDWSKDIPTATAAGSYSVFYRPAQDKNYSESQEGMVTATIKQKELTASLSGSATKEYDGSDAVTEEGLAGLTISLEGICGEDEKKDDVTATVRAATYASSDAGNDLKVTAEIELSGEAAKNYTLSEESVSGDVGKITPKEVTPSLSGTVAKEYDGTTGVDKDNFEELSVTLNGVIKTDAKDVTASFVSVEYASANVGEKIDVTVNGIDLGGEAAKNYILTKGVATASIGTIKPKELTATLSGSATKEYDGGDAVTEEGLAGLTISLEGVCGENEKKDDVTATVRAATYASSNAGEELEVTISPKDIELSGVAAGNYVLSMEPVSAPVGEITQKDIANAKITLAKDKLEYDGEEQTVAIDTVTLGDQKLSEDDFDVSGNTGTAKGDYTLTITGKGNYSGEATTEWSITNVQVYIDGLTAVDKEYDGKTEAELKGTAVVKKVSDGSEVANVTVSDVTAAFEDKTARKDKAVTLKDAVLSDDNYELILDQTKLTATIEPKEITFTGVSALNKEYDGIGETEVTGSPSLSGVLDNDVVTLTQENPYAVFDDAAVGENKEVTLFGYSLKGDDADNYTLVLPELTATIYKGTYEPHIDLDVWTYGSVSNEPQIREVPSGVEKPAYFYYTDEDCKKPTTKEDGAKEEGSLPTDAGIYYLKATFAATENYEAAEAVTRFTIEKADQDKPELKESYEISGEATTAKIEGLDENYEYRVDGITGDWKDCNSDFSLKKGAYYIRKKADKNHNAGEEVLVIVKGEKEYTLAVIGGSGSGSYEAGKEITIIAEAPAGEYFVRWEVDGVDLPDEKAPTITVKMPEGNVTLKAVCDDKEVTKISLNKTSVTLQPKETVALKVSYTPKDVKEKYRKVSWESSDSDIAEVREDGTVVAKAEGKAIITVTLSQMQWLNAVPNRLRGEDRIQATCEITVRKASGGGSGTGGGSSAGGGSSDAGATKDPAKDTSDKKNPTTKEETTVVTEQDGSVKEVTKVSNADGSTTEKEKVTQKDGTVDEKVIVTAKDGSVTETEKITTKDGTVDEKVIVTAKDGSVTETEKITTKDGTVDEKVTVTTQDGTEKLTETVHKADGSEVAIEKEVKANGDYHETTVSKDTKGKVTKTVSEEKTTNAKTGEVTNTKEVALANGKKESSSVTADASGHIEKAVIRETTAKGKSETVTLTATKSGKLTVDKIDATMSNVVIPDQVVDANGVSHDVTTVKAKALDGAKKVKSIVIGKKVTKFEANALAGSAVNKLELNHVPKFARNSLKNGKKMTIVVHSKADQKAVQKQLKVAGAPNAKVKVVKTKK